MKTSTTEKNMSKRASTENTNTNLKRARTPKRSVKPAATERSFTSGIRDRVNRSLEAAAQIDRTQLAWGLAGTAAVGAGAYFLYRSWSSGNLSAFVRSMEERFGIGDSEELSDSQDVPEGLPLGVSGRKPSPSIRDEEGNYDIDGASYDVQGVVIGSDNHKNLNPNA